MKHTVEQAKAYVAEWIEDITASYEKDVPEHQRHDRLFECWKAGCWLNAMLRAHECNGEELTSIGFCHGQRSAFGNTWEWAVKYLNEYEESKSIADKPGVELADRINEEMFASLRK